MDRIKIYIFLIIISRLPQPEVPRLGLTSYLLADSFIAAIVSYATLMSMALILAKGEDYQVDANQELLAMVCKINTPQIPRKVLRFQYSCYREWEIWLAASSRASRLPPH